MNQYISFREDAVAEFLAAVSYFSSAKIASASPKSAAMLARCLRVLHLAYEKAIKDAVCTIDSHLLFVKPEPKLLLDLRRDLRARPAPTVFCSRQPVVTFGLIPIWQVARDLFEASSDPVFSDFERALKRLSDLRDRAQHGEYYESADDVLAVVNQLLARTRPVFSVLNATFLADVYAQNNQIESQLVGIERDIDAAWQVLVDYLSSHGDLRIEQDLICDQHGLTDEITLYFGGTDAAADARFFARVDVPVTVATGVFGLFLTPEQSELRMTQRKLIQTAQTRSLATGEVIEGVVPGAKPLNPPLLPLDAGSIRLDGLTGWLRLLLPRITPSSLSLNAVFENLELRFDDGLAADGVLSGRLRSALSLNNDLAEPIEVSGTVHLTLEGALPEDLTEGASQSASTLRRFRIVLGLTARSNGKP